MLGRIRSLPVVRNRSDVECGIFSAVACVLVASAAFTAADSRVLQSPPADLLTALAGVGSAVFIAYTVGISGVVRQIRRGFDSEILLGFLIGLSLCGISGVGLAVALIAVHTPYGWFGELAYCWAWVSVIFLAGLVASLPVFAYDESRNKHLNSDE